MDAVSGAARLALISRLDLHGHLGDPQLDAIVDTLAAGCRVPMAVISVVTPDRQTYPAEIGVGAGCTEVPDLLSFCAEVVMTGRGLQVADSLRHPVYADNPFVLAGAVRAYAGEPLIFEGCVIGAVSLSDPAVRTFDEQELIVLRAQARLASAAIAWRAAAAWDRLTGLALRPLLLDRTTHAMADVSRLGTSAGRTAMLVLNVAGMTTLNAAFGSDRGDEVLRAVALRIRQACGDRDSPARIGGDEFAVLFRGVRSVRDARQRAAGVLASAAGASYAEVGSVAFRTGLAITPSAGPDALLASAEQSAARRRQAHPVSLLDATESAMCAVSADGTVEEVNAPWRAFATANDGDPVTCGVGANYLTVCDTATGPWHEGAAEVSRGLRQVLDGQTARFEFEYPCHSPGVERWFSLRVSSRPHGAGAVLSHHDITVTKLAERSRARASLRDALAGLPDRARVAAQLEGTLADGRLSHHLVAVASVGVDGFAELVEARGRPTGEAVLEEVAHRLIRQLRGGDLLARVADDEFVVVWADLGTTEQASQMAVRMHKVFATPIPIEGGVVEVTASVGVTIDDRNPSAEELLLGASAARLEAQVDGGGHARVVTPDTAAEAPGRMRTEASLRRALQHDELVVHYQPVVDLISGAVVGVEALVRWQHPTDGLLGPDLFIPVAEASGLIVKLGTWVLREACAQAVRWHALGMRLDVAVNLSTRQIADPNLVATVADVLHETGMHPRHLVLEVTESAVMEDAEAAAAVLGEVAALGASLAIDDFGTGYSSLTYLKRYPIRALKIDRSFVSGMGLNDEDDGIVASVIGLARAVGALCIAEGIETEEQYAALRALGCGFGQGWLFGRAVPAEALPALVQECEQGLAVRLGQMPPPGDQRDRAGDRRDHAAAERDHVADERDLVGDRRDQHSDERDEAGDQRDAAGDQRDLDADGRDEGGTRRDDAADRRDDAADRRDFVGARRDEAGDQRDRAADQRDRSAQQRDEAAAERDEAADARDASAERAESARSEPEAIADADRSARERRAAAQDRSRALQDRRAGASERNQSEQDRATAMADRGAGASERTEAEHDRDIALSDRGAGASERTQAEHDRDTGLADRRASAAERTGAERDRDTALTDRGAGATERTQAEQDRGTAMADRGAAAADRSAAAIDPLTGLYGRGAGVGLLRREMSRMRRAGSPMIVAFLDVDGLKRTNDTHGHAAGDDVLRKVSDTVRAHLRSSDLLLRYGGDEFICALSGVGTEQAVKRFAHIHAALAEGAAPASVSVGLAEMRPDDSVEDLICRADAALYATRQARRP